jgi:hypothetical protein
MVNADILEATAALIPENLYSVVSDITSQGSVTYGL